MTPTISTRRLSLRQVTRASQRQVDWLKNPEVVRYSEQRHLNHTLSTQLRYIGLFTGRSHLWGIYLAETGDHIGNLSAMHDEPNNVTDVGILIGEQSCWGKGIGKEAWTAACDWLLDQNCGAVRKLEAGCMHTNKPMMKIIQESRFQQEGIRSNHFWVDSGPVHMMLFGRSR